MEWLHLYQSRSVIEIKSQWWTIIIWSMPLIFKCLLFHLVVSAFKQQQETIICSILVTFTLFPIIYIDAHSLMVLVYHSFHTLAVMYCPTFSHLDTFDNSFFLLQTFTTAKTSVVIIWLYNLRFTGIISEQCYL